MPKQQWTMERLETISNKLLILALIEERASDLRQYSKLTPRLRELVPWVEANVPGPLYDQPWNGRASVHNDLELFSVEPEPPSDTGASQEEEPESPSDAGASQPTLDGEEAPKKTGSYRKPDVQKPSGHRRAVKLSPTQEAAVVRDYLDELKPSEDD